MSTCKKKLTAFEITRPGTVESPLIFQHETEQLYHATNILKVNSAHLI